MIQKAVTAVYVDTVHDDKRFTAVPEWLPILQGVTKKSAKQTKEANRIQFLGLVSLYQNKSGTTVTSFRLHSFVLYSYNEQTKSTKVHLLLSENRVSSTSAQERLLQILQMIQGDQVGSCALMLAPDFIVLDDSVKTFQFLGFTSETSKQNADWTVFHRKSIIKISKFTNCVMWGHFGQYLSFQDECSASDAKFNVFCCTVSQLLMRPTDPSTAIGLTYKEDNLVATVLKRVNASKGIHQDVEKCAKAVRNLAAGLTRIPLAVITHAIVNCHKKRDVQQQMFMYETTMELLQYVSVSMVSAKPYHNIYVGDCHTCTLYCEKCDREFGVQGYIFQVLREASHAILHHNGLELAHNKDTKTSQDDPEIPVCEDRYRKSSPMHSTATFMNQFSSSVIDRLNEQTSACCLYGTRQSLTRSQHSSNINSAGTHPNMPCIKSPKGAFSKAFSILCKLSPCRLLLALAAL
jgi:hypothetical protein